MNKEGKIISRTGRQDLRLGIGPCFKKWYKSIDNWLFIYLLIKIKIIYIFLEIDKFKII